MIKRRKVLQEHIDIVNNILDKLVSGELNTIEAMKYVNEKAQEKGIANISQDTIISIAEELLENNTKKLEEYRKTRRHNMGARNPNTTPEEKKEAIIKEELAKVLKSEIQLTRVAEKYGISLKNARNIIEDYLKNDEEQFKKYKETVAKNIGASLEKRQATTQRKDKIKSKDTVTNKEFVLLDKQTQKELIVNKFLKNKIKEDEHKGISNEQYVYERLEELIQYFNKRNLEESSKGILTEEDILYMAYRFPTMLNYSIEEKIEPTIKSMENNQEIGYINTSHILRVFPAILGYSKERTEKQLEILQKNNLIGAIIESPMRFMNSPDLMYAQIEFAKERHKTNNLERVKYSNIFMPNPTMKRLYKTNYDEIKKKYPLEKQDISIDDGDER